MSSSNKDYLLASKGRLSVAVHLVVLLLVITVPLLSVLVVVNHRNAVREGLAMLHSQTSLDADQVAQALTLPVWNLDETQATQALETVMGNRDIVAVELRAHGLPAVRLERDDSWAVRRGTPGSPLPAALVERRTVAYGGQTLGELRLEFTERLVREGLAAHLHGDLLHFLLLEILLVVCLWYMLRRLILRPLRAVEAYAEAVSKGSQAPRELQGRSFRGELATLRESIERTMRLLGERLDESTREARLRRESEERLRTIYDSVNDGIMIRRANSLEILEVNSRTCEMYGYTREEFAGLTVGSISSNIPPYTAEVAVANTRHVMSGEPLVTEWQARRKDGSLFWVELALRKAQVLGEDRILVVIRDISERRRQQEERERLEAQLRESHRMESIGILAGGIAHDFNNILCGLLGFCQMAEAETRELPQVQEHLGNAIRAVQRATDLVRQILTFSRQGPHEMQPVLLTLVLREVMKLLRAALPDNIEIVTDVEPELPAVIADPSQIHQILMNLATNSLHAMRRAGGVLRISLARVELDAEAARLRPGMQAGPHIRIQVSDTGHGMDEATLRRIYEPFFTTKPHGQGTGLGLSVVHGIVKSHHGSIAVRSTPGQGTVFEILLPALSELVPEVKTAPEPVRRGSGQRILFVDNESAICLVAKHSLKRHGFEPMIFADPREALEYFKREPHACDLMITDLSMPGMSGLELAEEVQKHRCGFPVILSTGFISDERMAHGRKVGVQEFLFKPIDMDSLAQAIARVLGPKVL